MAEFVIELARLRSDSVFEARPLDDLETRQRDITCGRDLAAPECEVYLGEGLGRASERYGSQLQEAVAR